MKVIYAGNAKEDRDYWATHSTKILDRIDALIADIKKTPFCGIGKPEPLRFQYTGYWSRRINQEHRLVYKIHANTIYIVQCRYHY